MSILPKISNDSAHELVPLPLNLPSSSFVHHHIHKTSLKKIRKMSTILQNFLTSNKLKYAKLGYHYLVHHFIILILVSIILTTITIQMLQYHPNKMFINLFTPFQQFTSLQILSFSMFIIFVFNVYYLSRPRVVYLIDYACYKPPSMLRAPFSSFLEHSRILVHDKKSLDFQMKILGRSGLGEETCLPHAIHYIPPNINMISAQNEAKEIMFRCLDKLFTNTSIKPKDVHILVVNCSLFSPIPSLSSMIVNKYKLRSNIKCFNLSGTFFVLKYLLHYDY